MRTALIGPTTRAFGAAGALLLTLAGCGVGDGDGGGVPPARAAESPTVTTEPAGSVVSAPPISDLAVGADGRLAAAVTGRPQLRIASFDSPGQADIAALSGPAAGVSSSARGWLVPVPSKNRVLRVRPDGMVATRMAVAGAPVDAEDFRGAVLVALRSARGVAILQDGDRTGTIEGFDDAYDVIASDDAAAVVDRRQSSLTTLQPQQRDTGPAVRVGEGATHGIVDEYGRMLVLDTRNGELLIHSTNPLLLRQRYPVAGAPFGIAYDRTRGIAWITLTGRNQLVGLDVRGGQPRERYRLPTVRDPQSVAVSQEGTVAVASASGGGIQVLDPGEEDQ